LVFGLKQKAEERIRGRRSKSLWKESLWEWAEKKPVGRDSSMGIFALHPS
jgi:hypothetical protein